MKPNFIDPRRIPKEHRELLHEAGHMLVRALENFRWQSLALHFTVPPATDKFSISTMTAKLDNPGDIVRLHRGLFDPFVEVMQKLWEVCGPEPWRSGRYEIRREGDQIFSVTSLKPPEKVG